jgi:4-diphosphocytidyl-2-C-methyl-D-erythritol kinase
VTDRGSQEGNTRRADRQHHEAHGRDQSQKDTLMMWIRRRGLGVQVWTPAKVNLFLEVLGRRPDGYHDLATLMLGIGWYDTLELLERGNGEVILHCDTAELSTGPQNLIVRAAELLRSRLGIPQGVEIRLSKRIPMQAGLAGGSSDAAATLAGLNQLWRLGHDAPTLAALGAELGSDVSFFFHGPAAWCTGRGEIVQPLSLNRSLELVLVCPRVGLSTASVFRALQLGSSPISGQPLLEALQRGDLATVGRSLFNRLEEPAERLCPEVRWWREQLAATASLGLGCLGARMSGSGSAVFALAQDAAEALQITRAVAKVPAGHSTARVLVVRSCD